MMEPKTATEIPATMMVVIPVPNQTINNGARADFGKLFKITRYGSKTSDNFVEYHNAVDTIRLIIHTRKKLRKVSTNVIPM